MACQAELTTADDCVQSEDGCGSCFNKDNFAKTFPGKAENYFRSALAFKNPGDPEFCVEANWRVCKKFYPVENGESVSNSVVIRYKRIASS